jgi:putative intracellular protease/amidase
MKFLFLSLLILAQASYAKAENRVLIVLNDAFQPTEYFEPRKAFEAEGFLIKTASRFGTEAHAGRKNTDVRPVTVDYSYEQIEVEKFDAIVFVGGGGAWSDFFPDKALHSVLVKAMNRKGMTVGLICAGTGLLAMAKNLDGKTPQFSGRKVTGYGDVEALLTQVGKLDFSSGDLTKPHVVIDGNLVTGRDPMSAELFGKTMTNKILGKD